MQSEKMNAIKPEMDKLEKKYKDESTKVKKIKVSKEANKSEADKAENEKIQIALAAGLKYGQHKRIQGNNPDEWKEDAKRFAAEIAEYEASQNRPAPLGSGSSGESTGEQFANFFNSVLSTT